MLRQPVIDVDHITQKRKRIKADAQRYQKMHRGKRVIRHAKQMRRAIHRVDQKIDIFQSKEDCDIDQYSHQKNPPALPLLLRRRFRKQPRPNMAGRHRKNGIEKQRPLSRKQAVGYAAQQKKSPLEFPGDAVIKYQHNRKKA